MIERMAWCCMIGVLSSCCGSGATLHYGFEGAQNQRKLAGATVSVLGLVRDGRMRASYWGDVAKPMMRVLQGSECELGFGDHLQDDAPDLYAQTDAALQESSINDEMLSRYAPRARGTVILALTIGAHEHPEDRTIVGGPIYYCTSPRAKLDLDITMDVFSVESRKIVTSLLMHYSGDHFDQAMELFTAEARKLLPAAGCAGWRWSDQPDADNSRQVVDH